MGPDQDLLRRAARTWMTEQVMPFHSEWEAAGRVPREVWEAAGEQGFLCVDIPAELGGVGASKLDAAVLWEEQAYAGASALGFPVHSSIVAPYIAAYGSAEQQERWLPAMASGKAIGSIAMTEPGAGSDLAGITTRATRVSGPGSDFVLNGSKVYITNGFHADLVVVAAKTEPGAGAKGISLLLVDTANTPGFSRGPLMNKVGLRGSDTVELYFDNARVPASALLGELNAGFVHMMHRLPQERLLIGVQAVSAGEAVWELAREHAQSRTAFGKPLLRQQTIAHSLAQHKTALCAARAFIDACIQQFEAGQLDAASASMAKAHATEVQWAITDFAVQLFGGAGYMADMPVARRFLDARVQRIFGGANEVMWELISRRL